MKTFCHSAVLSVAVAALSGCSSTGSLSDVIDRAMDKGISSVVIDARSSIQDNLRASFPALSEMKQLQSPPADYAGKVTLFGYDGCPYSRQATEYLQRNNIDYIDMDVDKNRTAKLEFDRLGGRGVPMIVVSTETVGGFNAQLMSQLLEKHGFM